MEECVVIMEEFVIAIEFTNESSLSGVFICTIQ